MYFRFQQRRAIIEISYFIVTILICIEVFVRANGSHFSSSCCRYNDGSIRVATSTSRSTLFAWNRNREKSAVAFLTPSVSSLLSSTSSSQREKTMTTIRMTSSSSSSSFLPFRSNQIVRKTNPFCSTSQMRKNIPHSNLQMNNNNALDTKMDEGAMEREKEENKELGVNNDAEIMDSLGRIGVEEEEEEGAATLRSLTFCYVPKDKEPELLCDFLMELGACSTSITDADLGTELEEPLFREEFLEQASNNEQIKTEINSEKAVDELWKDTIQWAAPLWNRCNVTAHLPASVDLPYVLDMVKECLPEFPIQSTDYNVDLVPNRDWVVHVQQGWKPIVISDQFLLRFPWHTKEDINKVKQEKAEQDINLDGLVELKLQGGIAFGTGEHPTTQLCLEWIHDVVQTALAVDTTKSDDGKDGIIHILDYGAGSGVLGLGGCALAAASKKQQQQSLSKGQQLVEVRAIGIDIDIDAIQIANENAIMNGLQDSMSSYLPPLIETDDDESKSLLLKAHAYAQQQISKKTKNDDNNNYNTYVLPDHLQKPIYDICVANILAGPLIALSSVLYSLIKPGGKIGMSGILSQQADQVIDAYSKASFVNLKVQQELDGWVLITGNKK